ncbi:MAG: hypothetical protein IKU25_02355 [Clostridia bacterium]|nr:hypothetical protein [Clostridia bacterium]
MKFYKKFLCFIICIVMVSVMACGAFAQSTASLSINVVSGEFSMSINGGKSRFMGSDYNNSFADVGTRYTVVAENEGGYDFLYWKNSNGKILSTDEEYSFVLGYDTSIVAVYNKPYASRGYVTFITDSKQEISRQLYSSTVSADNISIAAELSRPGYVFEGWSIDGVTPIAYEFLREAIKDALVNGDVTVTPIYTKDFSQQFSVNVTNAQGSGSYYLLSMATVTADETSGGAPFRCWQNADGEVVSFEREYRFAVTKDETLTATYSSEEAPQTVVNRISAAFSDSTSVTFVSERSLGDGLVNLQSGIIIVNSRGVGTNPDSFVLGGSGVLKGTTSSTDNSGTYILTKMNTSGTWYARPYVIYEDANGATVTSYGDIVSVSTL